MKRILKLGDQVYAQSLQQFVPSYLIGFPQREQQLFRHLGVSISIDFYRHEIIDSIDDIHEIRQAFNEFLSKKNDQLDYLLVDNPLSSLIIPRDVPIPILFDCIDWYDEMYLKEYGVDRRFFLLRYGFLNLLQKADKVVVQSPVLLKALTKWGLKTKKHAVIPNGFDSDIFFPYKKEKRGQILKILSEKYKLNLSNRTILVYSGKLGRWYENIKTIVEALEENQIFFIVGDGPLLREIPDRNNIIKCGPVKLTEVPEYTNIADVLVFPVGSDCSPIAISEYLAVGKPIVMEKGRIDWLLKDGKTGYLVDNNIAAWRNGIRQAIANRNKIQTYNLRASKKLSWKYLAKEFQDFLN